MPKTMSLKGVVLFIILASFVAHGDNRSTPPSHAALGGNSRPAVTSAFPAAQSEEVPLDTVISVAFNRPMNRASVENAFHISPGVQGMFSWDSAAREVTFIPSVPLQAGTQYSITIDPEAHIAGNGLEGKDRPTLNLAEPYSLSFRTLGNTTILIDTSHGSALAYSHEIAYASLAALLDDNGYAVEFSSAPLGDALRSGEYDVVMLAIPRSYYTAAELVAVQEYVGSGGRLILLGEFSHMRGTQYLHKVANGFGLGFDKNVLYDTSHNVDGKSFWPVTSTLSTAAASTGALGTTAYFAAASVYGGQPLVTAESTAYSRGTRSGDGPLVIASRTAYGEGDVTIIGDADFGANSQLPLGTGLHYHNNCHFALYLFGGGACTLD